MSETLLAALIGASATIAGTILTIWYQSRRQVTPNQQRLAPAPRREIQTGELATTNVSTQSGHLQEQSAREIGDNLVHTNLESSGFTVIDEVIEKLSLVVAARPDIGRIGIWVKTRERRQGDDETRFNVADETLLKKFERWFGK
jgi:hypothetical protein